MPRTRSQADKMESEEHVEQTMEEPERTAQGDNPTPEPTSRAPSEESGTTVTRTQYPLRHDQPPKSPSAAMTSHCTEKAKAARKAAKKKRLAALYEELEKTIRAKISIEEQDSEDEDEEEPQTETRRETDSTHGIDNEERVITWLDTATKDTNPGAGTTEQIARPTVEGPVPFIEESVAPRTEDPVPGSALKPCIKKSPPSRPPTEEAQEPTLSPATAALPPLPPAQHSNISELAVAINAAIRAAAPTTTGPRYIGELPPFSGAHTDWLAFRAAYLESASHLSPSENSSRLRRALKGKAREAVASMLISNTTPGEIMKQLEQRFGRPDNIASTEIDKLRHLPRLTDSPRDIIIFANKIKNSVVALQVLGQSEYLRAPDVMKIIVEKLPATIRFRWNDYINSHRMLEKWKAEPELLIFAEFIEFEAETNARYSPPEHIGSEEHSTSHRFRAQGIDNQDRRKIEKKNRKYYIEDVPCPVCKGLKHTPVDCAQFKSTDSKHRWEIAKQSNLCYRCLQYRNRTHNCTPRMCNRDGCERTHHPLLHFNPKTERQDLHGTYSHTIERVNFVSHLAEERRQKNTQSKTENRPGIEKLPDIENRNRYIENSKNRKIENRKIDNSSKKYTKRPDAHPIVNHIKHAPPHNRKSLPSLSGQNSGGSASRTERAPPQNRKSLPPSQHSGGRAVINTGNRTDRRNRTTLYRSPQGQQRRPLATPVGATRTRDNRNYGSPRLQYIEEQSNRYRQPLRVMHSIDHPPEDGWSIQHRRSPLPRYKDVATWRAPALHGGRMYETTVFTES